MSTDHQGLDGVKVGDVFCEAFVKRLPEGVDAMGENGEFHTHVFHDNAKESSEGTEDEEEEEEEEEEDDSSESEADEDDAAQS